MPRYSSAEFDRIVYVDRDVTGLYFSTDFMTGIEGLEQLEFIEINWNLIEQS